MRAFTPSLVAIAILSATLIGPAGAQAPPETKLQVVEQNEAATLKPTTVGELKDLDRIPEGYWAHGSFGDVVLRNDLANIVFGAVPQESADSNQARQGTIIDIFSQASDAENFQLFQPSTSVQPRRTSYVLAVDYTTDALNGSATVTTVGKDMTNEGVAVDTAYEMRKNWPGVLATTTVTNDSEKEVTLAALSDLVGWGGMGTFIPSRGWGLGRSTVPKAEFIFGRLYDSVIMVAPATGFMEVEQHNTNCVLIYAKNVKLAPGESRSFSRWILTGRSDPGKLFGFLTEERLKDQYGILAGRVLERVELPDGKIHESGEVANSEVRISVVKRPDLDRSYMLKPYLYTTTNARGEFQQSLPPGEYVIAPSDAAREFRPSNLSIPVKVRSISPVDQPVSKASGVVYEIIDKATGKSIPAKLSFVALRGTPTPELGPPGALLSSNIQYTATGKGTVDLAPGNYRVVVSHGNEFHTSEERIRVKPMQTETLRFELERAFTPTGWISADLGVLTNETPRVRTTPEERVISAAAEGLQWIVTADPEAATNLQPYVERLGLSERLRASPGFRITTTADRPVGDLTLFPIDLCKAGTAADMQALLATTTPEDAIKRLRALCPDGFILANRPLFPGVGLMAVQGVDLKTPKLPTDRELFLDVDGMVVWEGKNMGLTAQAFIAWMETAFGGYRLAPLANSLSAGTFNQEPGYPRVYITSPQRDPRKMDLAGLVKSLKGGQVVVTNGPFIELAVEDKGPGSTVTARDGEVTMKLKVYSPNWANVASVTVNVNGQFSRKFIIPAGAVDPRRGLVFPTSGLDEDATFPIRVAEDSLVQVIVEGDPTINQDPVNPFIVPALADGSGVTSAQTSLAISGPIYVDFDGDGLFRFAPPTQTEEDVDTAPMF